MADFAIFSRYRFKILFLFFFFGYLYIANIYKILHFKQYDYLSYINKVIGIVLNYDTILLFLYNNP